MSQLIGFEHVKRYLFDGRFDWCTLIHVRFFFIGFGKLGAISAIKAEGDGLQWVDVFQPPDFSQLRQLPLRQEHA
jgi:hypothetical protein